ncbi:hypothetical protein HAX54_053255, partial [Datura stramonium]|nr:hypothetical protein [Datura stramonium]
MDDVLEVLKIPFDKISDKETSKQVNWTSIAKKEVSIFERRAQDKDELLFKYYNYFIGLIEVQHKTIQIIINNSDKTSPSTFALAILEFILQPSKIIFKV